MVTITIATADDVDTLTPIFDQYRQFYGQDSDLAAARTFLTDRLRHRQSVVLAAQDDDGVVGFTQLYPSFSSVSMHRIWILNDLFVSSHVRRNGIAKGLIDRAKDYARNDGAIRLSLATGIENIAAQSLYKACNWKRNDAFIHFEFTLLS